MRFVASARLEENAATIPNKECLKKIDGISPETWYNMDRRSEVVEEQGIYGGSLEHVIFFSMLQNQNFDGQRYILRKQLEMHHRGFACWQV